jgi:DNA-binding PadR family transcriptional regulator
MDGQHDPMPLKPDIFELLLALEAGDLHGYAILKVIEARGLAVAPSLLYRKIRRLIEDGLVEESRRRPRRSEDDARRRYYRLTADGRTVVRAEARRILELSRNRTIRRLAEGGGSV